MTTSTDIVAGLFGGGLLVTRLHRQDSRVLVQALRTSDLHAKVDTMASIMEDIVDNGALVRVQNGRLSDLAAGLDYGSSVPPNPSPSPVITAAASIDFPRPTFTRADAAAMARWPGRVSTYDSSGNLVYPANPEGNGIWLGKALATREPAAALMGLASVPLNDAGQAQLFDYFANIAANIAGSSAGVVGYTSYRGGDLLWGPVTAAGTTHSNSTTEANLAVATPVVIPAGYLRRAGDSFHLEYDVLVASTGTDTLQMLPRWGAAASGTALVTGPATDVANPDYARVVIDGYVRTANTGGSSAPNGVLQVTGQVFPATTVASTMFTQTLSNLDFAASGGLPIWLGADWSAASASDTATLVDGYMTGHRLPVVT